MGHAACQGGACSPERPSARKPCRRNGAAISTYSPASRNFGNLPSWHSGDRLRSIAHERRAIDRGQNQVTCRQRPHCAPGLRACWVKLRTALFRTACGPARAECARGRRQHPHLRLRQRSNALQGCRRKFHTDFFQNRVSALCSMISSASSVSTSKFGMLRSI